MIIDDDYWRREQMRVALVAHGSLVVRAVMHHDDVRTLADEDIQGVDIVLVDVVDELALGERGTDVYSGIAAIERFAAAGVTAIAVLPQRVHPLIDLRLHESGARFVYRRWEINSPDSLCRALLSPDPEHAVVRPPRHLLRRYGAAHLRANRAVREYEGSSLHGRLSVGASHRVVKLPRRQLDRVRHKVREAGFTPTEQLDDLDGRRTARWPDTRDVILRLIGRKDTPSTDFDVEERAPS
jgi:hypothetical protein